MTIRFQTIADRQLRECEETLQEINELLILTGMKKENADKITEVL